MRSLRTPSLVRPRSYGLETALVLAWIATTATIAALPSLALMPQESIVSATAFSPHALVTGRLWRLVTSGFVVDGSPWPQLAEVILVAGLLLVVADARTFWRAAVAGHVGATLLAYALIAALLIGSPGVVDALVDAPDYGVSAVWAGALGALAVVVTSRIRDRRLAALVLAVFVLRVVLRLEGSTATLETALAGTEHVLAFIMGAAATFVGLRRPSFRRGLRPGPARSVKPNRTPTRRSLGVRCHGQ